VIIIQSYVHSASSITSLLFDHRMSNNIPFPT
jgi:hypothetical protein